MAKTKQRKKINYMVNKDLLINFYTLVPPGKRSDAINEALEEWMIQRGREIASDAIDRLREEDKKRGITLTNQEFIKIRDEGRNRK